MSKTIPKVLILEHPPICKEGIGKTLYAFFALWPKDKLGQVYSVDLPTDETICNYYYINEAEKESVEGTGQIHRDRGIIYRLLSLLVHSKPGVIVRSSRYGHFLNNNKSLMQWINNFNPEVIFYGLGESVEENEYVSKLCTILNCKLVTYISDDYLGKWSKKSLFNGYYKKLKESYDKLIAASSTVVLISGNMYERYSVLYPHANYYVAQNALNRNLTKDNYYYNKQNKEIVISYTGNLGLGRWKVISQIAKAIKSINREQNEWKIVMNIYSPNMPSNHVKQNMTNEFCKYCGNVSGSDLDQVRLKSDVLLFVESFEHKYKKILETALSTKVPEYLSYGRVILSIGPSYSWSCKYMDINEVAVSVFKYDDIREGLIKVINIINEGNNELFNILQNSRELLLENHDFHKNADNFLSMVKEVLS